MFSIKKYKKTGKRGMKENKLTSNEILFMKIDQKPKKKTSFHGKQIPGQIVLRYRAPVNLPLV